MEKPYRSSSKQPLFRIEHFGPGDCHSRKKSLDAAKRNRRIAGGLTNHSAGIDRAYVRNAEAPEASNALGECLMTMSTLLIIVLLIILVGALPTWPHSRSWGYYPSGGLGLILLVVIVLLLMGRI